MFKYVNINISFLLFFIVFILVNFYSHNAKAYNCYGTSNAGSVAPDNGTVCANMYIVPSTSGAGAKKLVQATHSDQMPISPMEVKNIGLEKRLGKRKFLLVKFKILVEFFIIKETLMQILATGI